VNEAMTPTGVISEEYMERLDLLRQRLQFDKEDTDRLLGYSARLRIVPVVKDMIGC
jgi:hypothetical protein